MPLRQLMKALVMHKPLAQQQKVTRLFSSQLGITAGLHQVFQAWKQRKANPVLAHRWSSLERTALAPKLMMHPSRFSRTVCLLRLSKIIWFYIWLTGSWHTCCSNLIENCTIILHTSRQIFVAFFSAAQCCCYMILCIKFQKCRAIFFS